MSGKFNFLDNKFIKLFHNNCKKKLLYLPLNSTEIKQTAMEKAFVENNLDVCSFDFRNYSYVDNVDNLNLMFVEIAKWFVPDFIHMQLQNTGLIKPETLKKIKALNANVFISNWTGDIRKDVMKYFVDISKEIDLSLISSVGQLNLYKNGGGKNVDYWQIGYDEEKFYRMSDVERFGLNKKYNNDIVFCCNHYPGSSFPGTKIRQEVISIFQDKHKEKFSLYGSGHKISKGNIGFFAQNEIYNSSKIVLSINHFNDVESYFSDRQLISMASGTLTLCHYIPGLEKYFENKKDLVWFNSAQEAFDLAQYYLNNDEERESIAKSGANKVLLEHTYGYRTKELLNKIFTIKNEKTQNITCKDIKETYSFSSSFPKKLNNRSVDKVFLFTPYYVEKNKERQFEIDLCLEQNIKNKYIDKIFLFSNVEESEIESRFRVEKVNIIYSKTWTTYNEIIEFINKKEECKNSYNIISNTDIYLDDSVETLRDLDIGRSCVALNFWSTKQKVILVECGAEATWIFKGFINNFNYIVPMGKPGCEHRFLYELMSVGYDFYNISYDIICWHKHEGMERKYDRKTETVPKPYVFVLPYRKNP